MFADAFSIELPTPDIIQKIVEQKLQMELEEDFGAGRIEIIEELLPPKATITAFKQLVKNSVINKVRNIKPIEISNLKMRDRIVSFISSATNLRCQNFKLPTVSKHKVEEKVFRIKPNLNVTGTIASGLANMELIKLVSVGSFYDRE